jgi:DNA-binding Lrp family transcriptional regulator
MLDNKDEEILKYFLLHPEAPVKDVAVRLDMPRPTAQRRILNLRTGKHLREIVAVNPNSLGFTLRYRVDVAISTPNLSTEQISLRELAHHIMNGLPQDVRFKDRLLIENVHILLGAHADLSISVRAKNHGVLLEFVTEGLRKIRGVQDAATVQQAWSYTDEFVVGQ